MSKIKNGGLDQYGAEPFQQQQFGAAGVEGVKRPRMDGAAGAWFILTRGSAAGQAGYCLFSICRHAAATDVVVGLVLAALR